MHVKQKFSSLFYLKRQKIDKAGKIPVYVRVTIDGLQDEMSVGIKVLDGHWNNDSKTVQSGDPQHKALNKKIGQIKTDIERHFDLMQAKHEVATPKLVLQSYKTPLKGTRIRQEKIDNLAMSEELDTCIANFLSFNEKYTAAYKDGRQPVSVKRQFLDAQRNDLVQAIEKLVKKAYLLYDSKETTKTLMMAIDEHLLNFLELAASGHRSPNTLEKMMGRKRRYLEFMAYRYQQADIPLQTLEFSFVDQLFNYLLVQKQVVENTAMKYVQYLKEVIDRSVSKKWLASNVFSPFKCRYTDPEHDWLTMQEFEKMQSFNFEKEKLNRVRDIFLFSSFTGYSFQEVYNMKRSDIMTGIDGKMWIKMDRQKTSVDETVPLLPLPLQIIERYRHDPICINRNKLLPVPSNQEYNRCLKTIAATTGLKIILRTHKARFFFANEVTYNMGVPLKTISRMLGHKSVKTTEIYVRANRKNISENMEMVEKKLFGKDGQLLDRSTKSDVGGLVVNMKMVNNQP